MMEKADSVQKLYTRMRLWAFPDQFVIEPTDGSSGSSLAVSRVDGSMKLIGTFFRYFSSCFCYRIGLPLVIFSYSLLIDVFFNVFCFLLSCFDR